MKAIFLLLLVVSLNGIECSDQSDTCVSCKRFFNLVSNVSHGGDAIKQSLANLWSDYSTWTGKESKTWCNNALGQLFDLMNNNLNVNAMCYDIKACNESGSTFTNTLNSFNVRDDNCNFCYYVTSKVKEIVSGGPTEIEVKTYFEDACHYMQNFEHECLTLVDENIDALFKFINETFQPMDFCKSIRLCNIVGDLNMSSLPSASDLANVLPANMVPSNETRLPNESNPINCQICKKIVKIIQRQLQDNATDQQIVHVLEEVCEILPSKDKSSCQSVVSNYANKLIEILTQDIDSDTACTLAGLCVPQKFWNYLHGHYLEPHHFGSTPYCVECELIAHFIQNELYNYKNEEQIEQFIMHHLCNKMSLLINESNCNTFVQQYGPIIMQTIAQELFDPKTLCFKEIPLCVKKESSEDILKEVTNDLQEKKCQMCQDIIKSMHSSEKYTLKIEQFTKKACANTSKHLRVECGLMIKAFGPYFFEMLDHYENPKEICHSMDLCMIPGRVHLLGGHKCTYGPSYWCHSESHADACKAVDYCNKNVWNPKH